MRKSRNARRRAARRLSHYDERYGLRRDENSQQFVERPHPIFQACPRCVAAPTRHCRNIDGTVRPELHAARVIASLGDGAALAGRLAARELAERA